MLLFWLYLTQETVFKNHYLRLQGIYTGDQENEKSCSLERRQMTVTVEGGGLCHVCSYHQGALEFGPRICKGWQNQTKELRKFYCRGVFEASGELRKETAE